ncbi:putative serine/threonine-protein kinase [Capsicum chinense]|nr:putative serine/threonine-protein kinase [Capsicum chinense]
MVGMSFSSDLPLLSRAQNVLASEFEVVVVSITSFYFAGFFVGGRSLDGDRAKDGFLPWPLQMNIIVETASGLAYLYAYDIIQRDVKTRNILLNNNYHVKVADFRLSRLSSNDAIHVSTAPQGTLGYVDLEYHECYQLTDKTDFIFSGLSSLNLIPYKRCGKETGAKYCPLDHVMMNQNEDMFTVWNRTFLNDMDRWNFLGRFNSSSSFSKVDDNRAFGDMGRAESLTYLTEEKSGPT